MTGRQNVNCQGHLLPPIREHFWGSDFPFAREQETYSSPFCFSHPFIPSHTLELPCCIRICILFENTNSDIPLSNTTSCSSTSLAHIVLLKQAFYFIKISIDIFIFYLSVPSYLTFSLLVIYLMVHHYY